MPVQSEPDAAAPGPLKFDGRLTGLDMTGDELGHLKHADLALAIEDWLERVVRVDQRSLLLVLASGFLDVIPKLLGELGTRQRLRANNGSQLIVGLHGLHESGIGFTFGR